MADDNVNDDNINAGDDGNNNNDDGEMMNDDAVTNDDAVMNDYDDDGNDGADVAEENENDDNNNGNDDEDGFSWASPSWSSFQDLVKDSVTTTSNEAQSMIETNPSEWTTTQIIGLAIGTTLLVIILFAVLRCVRRCCCGGSGVGRDGTERSPSSKRFGRRRFGSRGGRRGGSRSSSKVSGLPLTSTSTTTVPNNDNTTAPVDADETDPKRGYQISSHPPRVIRKKVRLGGAQYDFSSSTSLPLGAMLHGAHKLREQSLTGLGVKVAVIDSGIDKDHPGFHGQVKKQRWYRSGTDLIEDDHGTHVASTIYAMAPDAALYDYRVFGATSKYGLDGDRAIARAIVQACEDGCHIINMSLRVSYPIVPAVKEAVELAHSQGVIMVCAAGNDGDGQAMTNEMFSFPARWNETISVAAVGKKRGLPVATFSESNPQVDFAAIGVDVIGFKPRNKNGGGDLFQSMQGTSMAAPHVTGLIAALMSHGKIYSDSQLRSILAERYTIDIGTAGRDNSTGLGFATFLSSRSELDALLSGKKIGGSKSKFWPSLSTNGEKDDGTNDYRMMT